MTASAVAFAERISLLLNDFGIKDADRSTLRRMNRHSTLSDLADITDITSAWVHWHNISSLMHRLGRRPPAEAEAESYTHLQAGSTPVTRNEVCMNCPPVDDKPTRLIQRRLRIVCQDNDRDLVGQA